MLNVLALHREYVFWFVDRNGHSIVSFEVNKWWEYHQSVQPYKHDFLLTIIFFDCYIAAVENGRMDVLRLLLRYGANVNGSHSMCGWNALHQATFQVTSELFHLRVNCMFYPFKMTVLYNFYLPLVCDLWWLVQYRKGSLNANDHSE